MNHRFMVPDPEAKLGGMPEPVGINYLKADPNMNFLLSLYAKEDYESISKDLSRLGSVAGNELDALSREADRHPPELITYNKSGDRVDEVKFHPSYQRMEEIGYIDFGLVAMSHRPGVMGRNRSFNRVLKYSFWYLFAQAEFGLCCPMSMTDSAAKIIKEYGSDELKDVYLPKLISTDKDTYWTAAQFMTEKQGGSDVGENTLSAKKSGDNWLLTGDKWFCSNVTADVALVLARPAGAVSGTKGLAMFLVPKKLANGERNKYNINRLKDKLGTKDMASGEVSFEGAEGYLVGEIENGFKQMMSMVNSSRLSNAVRSAAIMRRSYLEALYTARGRKAFTQKLADLPLMKENLFELLLDTEVAASMIYYTANIFDQADGGQQQAKGLLRMLTPLLKGYICKRSRYVAAEAMEIRGGNGYIEEWVNPKLVRDAHLGSIWEGTTNIVALDVLRAIRKNQSGQLLMEEYESILSELTSSHVKKAAKLCTDEMLKLKEEIEKVKKNHHASQEISAKRFMNKLYHLCALAVLLIEADYDIQENASYRKLYLLLHYYHRYINTNESEGFDESIDQWFENVADWDQIPQTAIDGLLKSMDSEILQN
ncbi:acyl-CoA dehydrogenase family protein [Cytobacillus purgationiresistens]|uniref:Alkylation response protein AidB-like acyl-CoA dehydrogenase n=1 Tax=Cytobacillus purgationiresistens TaxID=863449 RepID=A0ABU0AEI7_9BACI|nr:acyl-CoA dehydrogenase family protein [Cytobacillus purgationiresistens]MDQ0269667.1 alkylation response protein AidB-like acyl-CoA dehydrogenase [Cytobacillus purgationiresistens]